MQNPSQSLHRPAVASGPGQPSSATPAPVFMRRVTLLALTTGIFVAADASALVIDFNYDFDSTGFFASQERRDRLEDAAQLFSGFGDDLDAIQPGGADHWSADFWNPGTGSLASVADLAVPADSLTVFVGARDMSALGMAAPGGFSVSGTSEFTDAVRARGETGALAAPPTDFGPWGGSIAFDTDADWHFGSTTTGLDAHEYDFVSVAIHELAHVLGFGTAGSWNALTSGSGFTGPAALAVYHAEGGVGAVPLSDDGGHLAHGITSSLSLADAMSPQEVIMDPAISPGVRQLFTNLSYAVLDDVGWDLGVVPEPSALILLGLGGVVLCRRPR